jgi:hypothetical protein
MAKSTLGMIEQFDHEVEAVAGEPVCRQVMAGVESLTAEEQAGWQLPCGSGMRSSSWTGWRMKMRDALLLRPAARLAGRGLDIADLLLLLRSFRPHLLEPGAEPPDAGPYSGVGHQWIDRVPVQDHALTDWRYNRSS